MSNLDLSQQMSFFTREVKIVSQPNPEAFTQRVNGLLADGWMISGEMKVSADGFSILMIKPDEQFSTIVNRVLNIALKQMDDMF
jgi:hypothetical protein